MRRKIGYTVIVLFIMVCLSEIVLRTAYFQVKSDNITIWTTVYRGAKSFYAKKKLKYAVMKHMPSGAIRHTSYAFLYTEQGNKLLDFFSAKYESYFKRLVEEAVDADTKLILLYVPFRYFIGSDSLTHRLNHEFYRSICTKYKVEFIDATPILAKYEPEKIFLLPKDNHLSRFGNMLLADLLEDYISSNNLRHRSKVSYVQRPEVMGPRTPGWNEVMLEKPQMPYRKQINKQGFRNNFDLDFPKKKQRFLFLGDSYTEAVFIHNHDTLPEILNRRFSDREFINGAMSGNTISNELIQFVEKSKYIEPDVTILQVHDNDRYNFIYFYRNAIDRQGKNEPNRLEIEFVEALVKHLENNGN